MRKFAPLFFAAIALAVFAAATTGKTAYTEQSGSSLIVKIKNDHDQCKLCEPCSDYCHGVWESKSDCKKAVEFLKSKGYPQSHCHCKMIDCSCKNQKC